MKERAHSSWEQVTGLIALAVGVAAMLISAYTAYLQRNQARLAAWPHLYFAVAAPEFTLTLANKGVGPALVKRVDVRLDGQPVRDWSQLVTALAGPGPHQIGYVTMGRLVLTPGESATILSLPDAATRQKVQAARRRITAQICYCSVYDECWIVDGEDETRPTSRCAAPDASSFQQ